MLRFLKSCQLFLAKNVKFLAKNGRPDKLNSTEISESSITQYSADQNFLQLPPEPSYAGLPKTIILLSYMVDQFVHVKLLNLLDNTEGPDYMFKTIIE